MKNVISLLVILCLIAGSAGCGASRKTKGAVIGAGAGGAVGAVIGNKAGSTVIGAILGAAVGGAAGAYIGNYMDKQAAEIERDLEGAKVTRVGEGIKITFDSGLLFDVDKASLRPESKQNLSELAEILNKYADTNILIEGHTDATGTDEYNLQLSRLRAQSVDNYLTQLNVNGARSTITGYGEDQPIASNDTNNGRQANRRVELAIMANEKLKKAAREKTS